MAGIRFPLNKGIPPRPATAAATRRLVPVPKTTPLTEPTPLSEGPSGDFYEDTARLTRLHAVIQSNPAMMGTLHTQGEIGLIGHIHQFLNLGVAERTAGLDTHLLNRLVDPTRFKFELVLGRSFKLDRLTVTYAHTDETDSQVIIEAAGLEAVMTQLQANMARDGFSAAFAIQTLFPGADRFRTFCRVLLENEARSVLRGTRVSLTDHLKSYEEIAGFWMTQARENIATDVTKFNANRTKFETDLAEYKNAHHTAVTQGCSRQIFRDSTKTYTQRVAKFEADIVALQALARRLDTTRTAHSTHSHHREQAMAPFLSAILISLANEKRETLTANALATQITAALKEMDAIAARTKDQKKVFANEAVANFTQWVTSTVQGDANFKTHFIDPLNQALTDYKNSAQFNPELIESIETCHILVAAIIRQLDTVACCRQTANTDHQRLMRQMDHGLAALQEPNPTQNQEAMVTLKSDLAKGVRQHQLLIKAQASLGHQPPDPDLESLAVRHATLTAQHKTLVQTCDQLITRRTNWGTMAKKIRKEVTAFTSTLSNIDRLQKTTAQGRLSGGTRNLAERQKAGLDRPTSASGSRELYAVIELAPMPTIGSDWISSPVRSEAENLGQTTIENPANFPIPKAVVLSQVPSVPTLPNVNTSDFLAVKGVDVPELRFSDITSIIGSTSPGILDIGEDRFIFEFPRKILAKFFNKFVTDEKVRTLEKKITNPWFAFINAIYPLSTDKDSQWQVHLTKKTVQFSRPVFDRDFEKVATAAQDLSQFERLRVSLDRSLDEIRSKIGAFPGPVNISPLASGHTTPARVVHSENTPDTSAASNSQISKASSDESHHTQPHFVSPSRKSLVAKPRDSRNVFDRLTTKRDTNLK